MLHFVTSKYTTNKHILFRDNPKSSININWNAKYQVSFYWLVIPLYSNYCIMEVTKSFVL